MRKKYVAEVFRRLRRGDVRWLIARIMHALSIPFEAVTEKCVTGPILTSFAVTYRCNESCLYCEIPSRARHDGEPSTDDMKSLIDQVAGAGASSMSFFGGEPLIREDLAELVLHARNSNLSTNITTNGILLTPGLAAELIDAGLDSLNVSLDSSAGDYVNRMRNTPGAFPGAVSAISAMASERRKKQSHTPNISVSTVLTSLNCGDIDDTIRFVADKGSDSVYFNVMEVFPEAHEKNRPERFLQDRDKLADALGHLQKLVGRNPFIDNTPRYLEHLRQYILGNYPPIRCYAGYHSLDIDCYGNIFPCYYYFQDNRPIANIKDIGNLKKFWHGAEYGRVRKELLDCRKCFFGCQMELNEIYNAMTRKR